MPLASFGPIERMHEFPGAVEVDVQRSAARSGLPRPVGWAGPLRGRCRGCRRSASSIWLPLGSCTWWRVWWLVAAWHFAPGLQRGRRLDGLRRLQPRVLLNRRDRSESHGRSSASRQVPGVRRAVPAATSGRLGRGTCGDSFKRAMATAIRTIGHDDRLSLVEHLEELRTRLIVSGGRARGRVRHLPVAEPRAAAPDQQPAGRRRPRDRSQGARARSVRRRSPSRGCSKWRGDVQRIAGILGAPRKPPACDRACAACGRDRELQSCRRATIPRLPDGDKPHDAGDRGAVHDDAHRAFLLRVDLLAAGDPVRALRLRAARLSAQRARAVRPLLAAIPFLFAIGVAVRLLRGAPSRAAVPS